MGTATDPVVRFRGRPIERRPGETLLRSLARQGLPLLQRSIRYHRPRGPFCGVGACSQCLVRVNGRPNVRACAYVPSPGDRVTTENAWPSPRFDVLGVLDRLFYRGIDTSHGFRRPRLAAPIYQRVVRRLAGYGRLADVVAPSPIPDGTRMETDALVVGASRAGAAAAKTFAAEGVETVVVSRSPASEPIDRVRLIERATVVFLPPPQHGRTRPFEAVVAPSSGPGLLVRAKRVVLAPGAYDGPLLFAGSDRPGVMTAEGALSLAAEHDRPPFERALVFGGGERALQMVDRFGDRIEAVAAPGNVRGEIAERAARLEIPVHPRTLLRAAVGRSRVRRANLRARGGGASTTVPVDAIILAHRRLPNGPLFYQAGAEMEWRRAGAAYFPKLDNRGETTVRGLFAAGEAAGFLDVETGLSGTRAARASLGRTDDTTAPARVASEEPGELEGYYRELLADRAPGKWVLCACEDVLLPEVETAVREGYRGIEVIKRLTATGTGLCQGRYCVPDALLLLAQLEGRPVPEVGMITQRPPVFPASLETLAGLPNGSSEEVAP